MKRLLCTLALAATAAFGQSPAVTGLYNWIHGAADADRGFAFYQEVFGLPLANSPFGAQTADARVEPIRPRAQAASDPLVADLTNTPGARFRNVFMKLPGAQFGFELSEFTGIEQRNIVPNLWEPGAATMILWVRDLDATFAALRKAGAPVITLSGKPVKTAGGRSVFVRDPDNFILQVVQAPADMLARAPRSTIVVDAGLAITVSDLAKTRKFYSDLLGFRMEEGTRFRRDNNALNLMGLRLGQFNVATSTIPGTSIHVEFYEFKNAPAPALRWRIQDPGSPQMQLRVRDLDPLLEQVKARGYKFVSVGARPIQRAAGRFVFVEDPDGILIEFMHPR